MFNPFLIIEAKYQILTGILILIILTKEEGNAYLKLLQYPRRPPLRFIFSEYTSRMPVSSLELSDPQ